MRVLIGIAVAMLLLGGASTTEARGIGHPAGAMAFPNTAISNPMGSTLGPQTMNGGTLVNQGTIAGGNSTAITSTGPAPVLIQNSGTITSNTSGIVTTGSSSSTIINTGTINVTNSQTGGASATATLGTGIKQSTGP